MHRTCNAICTLLQPKMMIFAVTVKHRNWECFNESHAQTILKTRKIDMAILSAQMGKNPGIYSVSMRRFLQKTIFRVLVGIRNFYVILIVFLFPLPGTAGSTTRGTAGSTTRQRTHLQGRGSPSHHQQYSGSRNLSAEDRRMEDTVFLQNLYHYPVVGCLQNRCCLRVSNFRVPSVNKRINL